MIAPTGFLTRIRLEEAGPDLWSAAGGRAGRMALGLLGAQALAASGRTIDTRWHWVHALHVTRIGEGDAGLAVRHQVERTYDGRSRAIRLVRSVQRDAPLALTTVTFAAPWAGRSPSLQRMVAVDGMPPPFSVAPSATGGLLDVRHLGRPRWPDGLALPNRMWARMIEEIPDEILLHAAAIALAADLLLVQSAVIPAAGERADVDAECRLRAVPLDLSIRIHSGFRADDWMLHGHESVSTAIDRALTTGWFASPKGRLVASVSQEAALLPVPTPQSQAAFATTCTRP